MKRVLIIIGTVLLVVLGLFMPRLLSAWQDQSISGDMRQMENAAVSLSLTQKLVALPELDLIQSLELFSSYVTIVELEEGRYTTAEEALQIACELVKSLDMGNANANSLPEKAVPCLLTDEDGHSGIFWRCGWELRSDEAVWIDDWNGLLVGFCMMPNFPSLEGACNIICEKFIPSYVNSKVLSVDTGEVCIKLSAGEETFDLSAVYPMVKVLSGSAEPGYDTGYISQSYLYVYYNIPFNASAATPETGDSGGDIGNSSAQEGDSTGETGNSDSEISESDNEIENIDE